MSNFPAIDHTRFKWRIYDHDPSKLSREITGGEVSLEFFHHNHNDMVLFFGANIQSRITLPDARKFHGYARESWANVRRRIPTIAANLEHDASDSLILTYKVPSPEEVVAWLDRTVHFEQNVNDIDVLRTQLSDKTTPDQHGDMSWIYLVPNTDTSFDFLFHTSHVLFDASAGHIVINNFLRELSSRLTLVTSPDVYIPWGKEVDILCPCVTSVLGPEEAIHGDPRYDQSLGQILADLKHAVMKNYGFRPRGKMGCGRTVRLGYTFTLTETDMVLSGLRRKGYTPNHIAHAAMTLLILRDNPPPVDSDSIIAYFALLNGRQRLVSPYNAREGFPGLCVGVSIMKVPVNIIADSEGHNDQKMVEKIADVLKEAYQKQKEDPAVVAVMPIEVEYVIAPAKEAILKGLPLPTPWPAPWYSGDGVTERYLDRQHADSTGKVVLEIVDYFVSLNKTDPAPFFRCHSWNGQLSLSIDYNEKGMPQSDMGHIMNEWTRLIRLFIE